MLTCRGLIIYRSCITVIIFSLNNVLCTKFNSFDASSTSSHKSTTCFRVTEFLYQPSCILSVFRYVTMLIHNNTNVSVNNTTLYSTGCFIMYSGITKIYYRKTVGHVFTKPIQIEGTTQHFFPSVSCF